MIWLYTLLSTSIFITSAGSEDQHQSNQLSRSVVLFDQSKVTEDFNSFFERFKSDKSFQFSRTIFPLKQEVEDDEGKKSLELISKKQWQYLEFRKKKGLDIRDSNKGKFEKDIILSIADTGVMIAYHFKVKGNLWYFFKVTDMSD